MKRGDRVLVPGAGGVEHLATFDAVAQWVEPPMPRERVVRQVSKARRFGNQLEVAVLIPAATSSKR